MENFVEVSGKLITPVPVLPEMPNYEAKCYTVGNGNAPRGGSSDSKFSANY